ncbi:hypothetical protein TNCV_1411021 [Trichonephila clavipes]|nr:hypothetical protein TNCV_1411021 [Trichonephila clavipes]
MCRKRSLQGTEHKDRKRLAPEQRQEVKRSRFHPRSHPELINLRDLIPPHKDRIRTEGSGRDNKTRQTRATTRGRNKQEERPVRSNQATTRGPCPYYLRSQVKESDGIPEEQRNIEINGIPHSRIRRSLSMEALDGDPVHRRI